jgi:pre-rRNA-processing protein TSR3
MILFPPTIILRHRKENLKKCTLHGLEERPDFRFFTYPRDELPDLSNYLLLTIDAPPLDKKDGDLGIFLIDGTWAYAQLMERQLRYRTPSGLVNYGLCETKPNRSEAFRMRNPSLNGKGDEENRFGKVAASPNSPNLTECGIKPHLFQKRSLPPHFQTAYPRRQNDCPDPSRGLASVEALYLAYSLLGRTTEGLLNHFYWKEEFLKKNRMHLNPLFSLTF